MCQLTNIFISRVMNLLLIMRLQHSDVPFNMFIFFLHNVALHIYDLIKFLQSYRAFNHSLYYINSCLSMQKYKIIWATNFLFSSFLASRDSQCIVHRTQQSSWTVLYSDGSEAKDCQELPSIRLVRSRQWRSKSRITREKPSTGIKCTADKARSKKTYTKNGKLLIHKCYNWRMRFLMFKYPIIYLISCFFLRLFIFWKFLVFQWLSFKKVFLSQTRSHSCFLIIRGAN